MPTAAKLVSALFFLILCYIAAESYKPLMPPDTTFGQFSHVCAGIGALSGWLVMGRLAGHGYGLAASSGLRTMATAVFFALLLFSGREMILRSLHLRYKGPFEAVQAMAELMAGYAQLMLSPVFLAVVLMGGMAGGLVAEWTSLRWR